MEEPEPKPRPRCPKCTMAMISTRKPALRQITLECLRCGHAEQQPIRDLAAC